MWSQRGHRDPLRPSEQPHPQRALQTHRLSICVEESAYTEQKLTCWPAKRGDAVQTPRPGQAWLGGWPSGVPRSPGSCPHVCPAKQRKEDPQHTKQCLLCMPVCARVSICMLKGPRMG